MGELASGISPGCEGEEQQGRDAAPNTCGGSAAPNVYARVKPLIDDALLHALGFLRLVFGDSPPGYLVIWADDKRSRWFASGDLARAAQVAVGLAPSQNVYFGVGLRSEELGPDEVGIAGNVCAVPGWWADVSIEGQSESSDVGPSSRRDALDLVCGFPLAPTVVVSTGSRLQAYWLFKELWRFETREDMRRAQELSDRFQATLRIRAGASSWRVDNASDLARLLRLPGTLDHTLVNPAPVQILEIDGSRRYRVGDFEPHLVEMNVAERLLRPSRARRPVVSGQAERSAGREEPVELASGVDARRPERKGAIGGEREPSSWEHGHLVAAEFFERRWVIWDVMARGSLHVLAGRRNRGKSWMALQMAQAVARGMPFLGQATVPGNVLYLWLEEGARELRERLDKQRATPDLPITYLTRFGPLDANGIADLEQLMEEKGPILVVVDSLPAATSGQTLRPGQHGEADVARALRDLAEAHDTAILVLVHAARRGGHCAGYGRGGVCPVCAAADVVLDLSKAEGGYHVLRCQGKGAPRFEVRVEFEAAQTWCWQLVTDARQVARAEAEAEVVAALAALGEGDATTVARRLGKSRSTVQVALRRMLLQGTVARREEKGSRAARLVYRLVRYDHGVGKL